MMLFFREVIVHVISLSERELYSVQSYAIEEKVRVVIVRKKRDVDDVCEIFYRSLAQRTAPNGAELGVRPRTSLKMRGRTIKAMITPWIRVYSSVSKKRGEKT